MKQPDNLAAVAQRARELYAALIANQPSAASFWTAVILTASSRRQAQQYESEIQRRQAGGKIPGGVTYLVVPDLNDQRIGSGGATLNGVRNLVARILTKSDNQGLPLDLTDWWAAQRVLMIHSGGDSRRLPQYSLSGKLFSAVPVTTPWGETSTVFDEMMALSTAWAERLPSGLLVASGDVILVFDADLVTWGQPGVTGVAMLQPATIAIQHGVYVGGGQGRVRQFLQKPAMDKLRTAGGLLEGEQAALDTGLLCFAPDAAARLTRLGQGSQSCPIDLYDHVTRALTGEWKPGPDDDPALHALSAALTDVPFWYSLVPGDFTHIGTTSHFRKLMNRQTGSSAGRTGQRSGGMVVDSVIASEADLAAETVVIECHIDGPVRAGQGSVLHGLESIPGMVEIPADTVVHQIPIAMPGGRQGVVIRVYGVDDDPKASVTGPNATWCGRHILEILEILEIHPDTVWPGMSVSERTLWNAELFPVTTVGEAWMCARWLLRLSNQFSHRQWLGYQRLSLATSAQSVDALTLEAARARRVKAGWCAKTLSLVESGADIRTLLASVPDVKLLSETGDALRSRAKELETSIPTEAASRYYAANLFYAQAGLPHEAGKSRAAAYHLVERAVGMGSQTGGRQVAGTWAYQEVTVQAPARIDLGGGWSDTPPFCLDCGGTVLNVAVLLDGCHPIRTTVRRLHEPLVRCVSEEDKLVAEYRTCEEILHPARPDDLFSISRTALRMSDLFERGDVLADSLGRLGGGIEIRTAVKVPIGSGLGTSSILGATILSALKKMSGVELDNQILSQQVMYLEQLMTTGGGWQDQIGGIYPGAKLAVTDPGSQQRVRVRPVPWSAERAAEFDSLAVLYYTGIRRVARDLLGQIVGRYLARETACVQVLHSIKTLATEMFSAMQEGEWDHLGRLLDRHWELNQILDPNTANTPIHTLMESVRPFIRGAKIAGAGGGGFLILLARDPHAKQQLEQFLSGYDPSSGGAVYRHQIAEEGLCVKTSPLADSYRRHVHA